MTSCLVDEGQFLLREKTLLTFSYKGDTLIECNGDIHAFIHSNGSVRFECLLYCNQLQASNLLDSKELMLEGKGTKEFIAEGVTFTHISYDSTSDAQSLQGTMDYLSTITLQSVLAEIGQESYILLSPPVSPWRSATQLFFPELEFIWERWNPQEATGIGFFRISGRELGGTLREPEPLINYFEVLLSLATMSTVVVSGHQVVAADGRLRSEYISTRPIRCRTGFSIIPNYSRKNRREELVYYLGETCPSLEAMSPDELKGFKEAVLFAIEAEYDEFIKPKYLKNFLSLIILLRTFSDPIEKGLLEPEKALTDHLITLVKESDTNSTWRGRAIGALKNLESPSEREMIDALLTKYELDDLLPREVTSRIRGAIMHTGRFLGDDLEGKVDICQELSYGVCWLLLRILGYSGCFIHCWKDDFYTEIDAQTGEEFSTRS